MSVAPYLTIPETRATAALEFYKSLLGAKQSMRGPSDDGKRLMHVAP